MVSDQNNSDEKFKKSLSELSNDATEQYLKKLLDEIEMRNDALKKIFKFFEGKKNQHSKNLSE